MVSLDPTQPCIVHGSVILSPQVVTMALAHLSDPLALLARHLSGDWGDLPLLHALMNEHWLLAQGRVVSRYEVGRSTVVFIVTDVNPKRTYLLCEDEIELLQNEWNLTK